MGKANYPQIKVEEYYYRIIEESLVSELLDPLQVSVENNQTFQGVYKTQTRNLAPNSAKQQRRNTHLQ